ncbi:MAG: hypothetical protein K0R59_29 [Sphingobacterium sp.]|jgi:hypothetical protein|uniref:Uncharacterized protein n=1 Tax=Sphingobacterium detergens TaxID=1145106 RepID=A0A420BIL2_SPHD1|nr:hypothetical protein [Sphingobacterium sp.]RKE56552.1 hypothetical protein DFQ12_1417 [Sphingobacterium detergens]
MRIVNIRVNIAPYAVYLDIFYRWFKIENEKIILSNFP